MKRHSIHISIPTPCLVGWENMDAIEKGAFCHSCRTEVVDYSAMTDRELIDHLSKHKLGCGRFRVDQVDRTLTIAQIDNGALRWRALFLSILSLVSIRNILAQSAPKPKAGQSTIVQKGKTTASLTDTIQLQEVTCVCQPYDRSKHFLEGVSSMEIISPIKSSEKPQVLKEENTQPSNKHKVRDWFEHLFKRKKK